MRWPWRDLLFLHGHIVQALPPPSTEAEESSAKSGETEKPETPSFRRCSLAALRLCLGIGDGAIRSQ
jgi:hypothetical protein